MILADLFLICWLFLVLQKAFNAFDNQKNGYISTDMIATILDMLGHPQTDSNLQEIVSEIDADGKYCTFCSEYSIW